MMTLLKQEAAMIAGAIEGAMFAALDPNDSHVWVDLHRLAKRVVPGLRAVPLWEVRTALHDLLIVVKKRAGVNHTHCADYIDIAVREADAAWCDIVNDIGRAAGIECPLCGDQTDPAELVDAEDGEICTDCFIIAQQLV